MQAVTGNAFVSNVYEKTIVVQFVNAQEHYLISNPINTITTSRISPRLGANIPGGAGVDEIGISALLNQGMNLWGTATSLLLLPLPLSLQFIPQICNARIYEGEILGLSGSWELSSSTFVVLVSWKFLQELKSNPNPLPRKISKRRRLNFMFFAQNKSVVL